MTTQTARQRAIQAGAAAIRDAPDPSIWRSWESLAAAVIDAARPHMQEVNPHATTHNHDELADDPTLQLM